MQQGDASAVHPFSRVAKQVAFVLLALLPIGNTVHAQSLSEPQEWSERIKTAESIGVLGSDLFGDSTNYYNGQTSFSATDIDLPGNNDLPVRLSRKLGSRQNLRDRSQLLANWDLELPYMSGIYAAGLGWQNYAGSSARCIGGLLAPDVTDNGTTNRHGGDTSISNVFSPST